MRKFNKKYCSIIVLGGGLRRGFSGEFEPATYSDSDEFGMLGGHMRVNAALALHKENISDTFVFTTGVYQKNMAKFGPDVSPEAPVYARMFENNIRANSTSIKDTKTGPRIVLELKSTTTLEEIKYILQIAQKHQWQKVLMISSSYHIPRVEALYQLVSKKTINKPGPAIDFDFVAAEDVVKQLEPGKYDDEIIAAYATSEAAKRQKNENRGIQDIKNGKYAAVEFQLVAKRKYNKLSQRY